MVKTNMLRNNYCDRFIVDKKGFFVFLRNSEFTNKSAICRCVFAYNKPDYACTNIC